MTDIMGRQDNGFKPDLSEEAVARFEATYKKIMSDDMEAYYELGSMFFLGLGTPASDVSAFNFYRLSARAGHIQGILRTAQMLIKGEGCKKDVGSAKKWLEKGSELFLGDTSNKHQKDLCLDALIDLKNGERS